MPEISIIVPIYNVEKYLHRCIDSILKQTFIDFELILVNDGSTDSSGTICDEYAAEDSRILVIHKENGGVSSARNAGLNVAIGKYIMFCDGDDWTEPIWIETLYKKAEEYPNMCIIANMWRVTGEKENYSPIGKTSTTCAAKTYYDIWENSVSAYTPNKIYRREIIENNNLRFDPAIKLSEDLVFNLNYQSIIRDIQKNDKIYMYVSSPLYFYRMNNEGATRKYRPELMGDNLFPFYIRLPYIEQEKIGDYCDIWLYKFIHLFENVFDKRCKMTFAQKMNYNQRIIQTEEFRYCIAHCSGKKESPLVLNILRTHNYYLFWVFLYFVHLKQKLFHH